MTGRKAESWREFADRWLPTLVAILIRSVHDPALAFDLVTETLATARTRAERPTMEERSLADVIALARTVLRHAADDGHVSALERRRRHVPAIALTAAQEQELTRLSEHVLELPASARAAAEELARTAPPPRALAAIRLSGLVTPSDTGDRSTHGA